MFYRLLLFFYNACLLFRYYSIYIIVFCMAIYQFLLAIMNFYLYKLIILLRWMIGRVFRWMIRYFLLRMLWRMQRLIFWWMFGLWILDCFFNNHRLLRLFVTNLTYCREILDWSHSIVVFIERWNRRIIIVYHLDRIRVLWECRLKDSLLWSTCPCEMWRSFRLFREAKV